MIDSAADWAAFILAVILLIGTADLVAKGLQKVMDWMDK